jgi:hypothetical protein
MFDDVLAARKIGSIEGDVCFGDSGCGEPRIEPLPSGTARRPVASENRTAELSHLDATDCDPKCIARLKRLNSSMKLKIPLRLGAKKASKEITGSTPGFQSAKRS